MNPYPVSEVGVKVVVLGAGGLVGERLSTALALRQTFHVGREEPLHLKSIVLFDMRQVELPPALSKDARVTSVAGDLTDRATLDSLFSLDAGITRVTCIQLAALLSGYAEANFDLGMKVRS